MPMAGFMQQFLNIYWQIVLLRRGPEDLPESSFLLWIVGLLYGVINVISVLLVDVGERAFLLLLADFILFVGWATLVLIFFGMKSRLTRTLTALFGAGSLLQLLSLPLSLGLDPAQQQDWFMTLRLLGFLVVLLWAVAVYGHIIARAIGKGQGVGVIFAVLYFLLSFELAAQIIPAS